MWNISPVNRLGLTANSKLKTNYFHLPNYNTPITSQVDALVKSTDHLCTARSAPSPKPTNKPTGCTSALLQLTVYPLQIPPSKRFASSSWRRPTRPTDQLCAILSVPSPKTLIRCPLDTTSRSSLWCASCSHQATDKDIVLSGGGVHRLPVRHTLRTNHPHSLRRRVGSVYSTDPSGLQHGTLPAPHTPA